MKLAGSSSASSLLSTAIAQPSAIGNKNTGKDNLKDHQKDKKIGKSNASIPAFISNSTTSNKMGGASSASNEKGGKSGSGSFAAVAGGLDSGFASVNTGTTPPFGMISVGGPHP